MKPTKQSCQIYSPWTYGLHFSAFAVARLYYTAGFVFCQVLLKGGRRNERLWLIFRLSKNYTKRILFCMASTASASKYTKYSCFVQFERKPTRTKPSREWIYRNERANNTIIRPFARGFNLPLPEHAPRQEWRGGGVAEWGRRPATAWNHNENKRQGRAKPVLFSLDLL